MPIDPNVPPEENNPQLRGVPPPLPPSEPAVVNAPPPLAASSPEPLLTEPNRKPGRSLVAFLLNLCLSLFLADALVSLADDSLILFLDVHLLSIVRGVVFVFAILTAIVIYVLMGLTPMIPKRWFLPVTLFSPAAALVLVPCSIYFFGRIQQITCALSLCQVAIALYILRRVGGGPKFGWPLIPEDRLGTRGFSWRNLFVFVGVNVFVLAPAVVVYLFGCAAMAVGHFSDGFLALHPGGLMVQVRKYGRNDGKTIELFPMSHVADSDFYQKVSESFPTNSIILMEGVTDNKNLLTNKITYKRMAASLGLAEQHESFAPSRGEVARADVDVSDFAPTTIGLLNMAMLIHSKGVTPETVTALMQYPQPPHFEKKLFDDLIGKRNEHLVEEIRARLPESENIMVPWGALHMPEIAKEIQKSGFHLMETHDYMVIRFGSSENGKPK